MALQYFQHRLEADELLPKEAIGAEVGVDKGEHAIDLLRITRPSKLYLVDRWDYPPGCDGTEVSLSITRNAIAKAENGSAAEIVISQGIPWLYSIPECHLDWCYLDTTHEYEHTVRELQAMRRAVKVGGILAGHDFSLGTNSPLWKAGVVRAVIEAVQDEWLRLEGISDEVYATWVGRRIK